MSRHLYRPYLIVVLALLLTLGGVLRLAAWSGSPAPNVLRISAATMPPPTSASGSLGSTSSTSTSSYAASSYQYQSGTTTSYTYGTWIEDQAAGSQQQYTCSLNDYTFWSSGYPSFPCETSTTVPVYSTAYDCPNGGTLSGTTCYTTTTTTIPAVKFSWTATSVASVLGQSLAPNVQVVSSSSCTSTTWTTLTTVADSTGSYTVSNPSTSDYYAIRTANGSWIGPVVSCTQG